MPTTQLVLPTIKNLYGAHVVINEAFVLLDALVHCAVYDRLTTPPVSPINGDRYLVISVATGVWAGKENQIALYHNGWIYLTPKEGWSVWVNDENLLYRYRDNAWAVDQRAAAQADSVAATVGDLVTDFNALLSKLRSAGILTP